MKWRLIGKPLSSVRTGSSPGAPIIRLAVTRCRVTARLLDPFLGPKALPVSAGDAKGSNVVFVQSIRIASKSRLIASLLKFYE